MAYANREMTPRVKLAFERYRDTEKYHFLMTKQRLWLQAYKDTEGMPTIYRRTKAFEYIAKGMPIFIQDGELLVGNVASKPMGMEVNFWSGLWSDEEIEALRTEADGLGFIIEPEVADEMHAQNAYWKNQNFTARMESLLNPEMTMPFLEKGVALPPWKPGIGWSGKCECGWGIGPYTLTCIAWDELMKKGVLDYAHEAEEELNGFICATPEDCRKRDFLKCVVIAMHAIAHIGERFSVLALEMAQKEANPARRLELVKISEICARVPANAPRTFHEALQHYWFIFMCVNPNMVMGLGRMDQYLYPFYKADLEAGRITEEEAIELLECFRMKDMEFLRTGSVVHRQKWSGMSKWHNCVIGGVDKDGNDATNPMSYMLLEAAYRTHTPHHTITIRVHDKTPQALIQKGVECICSGMGLPAFVSDKSYMQYVLDRGCPLEDARDYAIGGCIDIQIPGRTRTLGQPMVVVPQAIEWVMNNGREMMGGKKIGLDLGDLDKFDTFEKFYNACVQEVDLMAKLTAEHNNVKAFCWNDLFPDPVVSTFYRNSIKVGRCHIDRPMVYENLGVLCCVGMVSLANSLAAIKKLCFDDKTVSLARMKEALLSNWEGEENQKIRAMCLAAPKYGNDIDYVDNILADLYAEWSKAADNQPNFQGQSHRASCISISAHWPGGAICIASPDGRYSGECLSDGGLSAGRGDDTEGPLALLRSALKTNQDHLQAVLLNMKFSPSCLKTDDDRLKFGEMIKTYLCSGGKHCQFNVVDKKTLEDAQKDPVAGKNVIVRVAGYSTYFTMLNKPMQDEIIGRTELNM